MNRLGLALGSGGARGWCHIGVLRQLEQNGVTPHAVAGCSMGALVGAAWAANKLDALEELALGFTEMQLVSYLDPALEKGGILRGRGVEKLLRDLDLPERIEDLDRPFLAVATDMATGREIWLREGPLVAAVRASVSIPGVFSPVRLGNHWLLDGGLINPVPVSAVRALGAERIVAVNPNAKGGRPLWQPRKSPSIWGRMGAEDLHDQLQRQLPDAVSDLLPDTEPSEAAPGYADVLNVSIDILTEFLRTARNAADPPDVLLDADLNHISVMELYRAGEAMDEGKRIAEGALKRIRALV